MLAPKCIYSNKNTSLKLTLPLKFKICIPSWLAQFLCYTNAILDSYSFCLRWTLEYSCSISLDSPETSTSVVPNESYGVLSAGRVDSSLHRHEGQQPASEDQTYTEYDDILTTTKFAGSEKKEVKLGHKGKPNVNNDIRPLRLGT